MECVIQSGELALSGHLARPPVPGATATPGLVLAHGFPAGPDGAATAAKTYPDLADRLCAETGWSVLSFNFRGTGESPGNFSLRGWLADLRAAAEHLQAQGISGVWVAGSSTGGALAIVLAASDPTVLGVAALAAPAKFGDWESHPRRSLNLARQVGAIKDPGFPADVDAWSREAAELRPLDVVGRLPPRPLMILHGADDETVPVSDARALAAAAPGSELHVLAGAGHRLRYDPRAVALLIGWIERQSAVT